MTSRFLIRFHIPFESIVHASKFIFSALVNNLLASFSSTDFSPDKLSKKETVLVVLRAGQSGMHSTDFTMDLFKLIGLYVIRSHSNIDTDRRQRVKGESRFPRQMDVQPR